MLFRTTTRDPTTYLGVTAFFLLLALAACMIPAWRALKVDPVATFRSE
jgi:ABC-type lipoprotein release transport system permease subunit